MTLSAVKQPLSSEKIASKKASSGKPFAWIKVPQAGSPSLGSRCDPAATSSACQIRTAPCCSWCSSPCCMLFSRHGCCAVSPGKRRASSGPSPFWPACSYFFIGAIRISVTMGFLAIFFRISYAALLSVAATHFIGSNSGAAVATLLTFYAAGIFGHTIAEYVQRAQSEEDQEQPSGCKEDQKQPFGYKEDQKQLDEPLICFLFVQSVLSLFILMRMVWVVLRPGSVMFIAATDNHANEALLVVEELSLETLFLVWPWACFVALILQEETVVSLNTMLYKVPASVAALYSLSIVFSIALGKGYGLLVLWPTPMAMAGLFGYILAMFARYNHIRAKDQQPMVHKVLDEPEQKVPGVMELDERTMLMELDV